MVGIRRAFLVTTAESHFGLVVSFATVVIVSRLLTPSEIGISVTGTAIATLAMSAREFATTNFLIQRKELTRLDIRGAVTAIIILGILISGSLFFSAPVFAAVYEEDRLIVYLRVVAISIFLEVISAPILALMRRDMAFSKVAVINVTSAALAGGMTITLAALGLSYMSFAWSWLAAAAMTVMLAIIFQPDLSIFVPLAGNWRDMLTFGTYNGVNAVLGRLYSSMPYFVLGRIVSFDAVGLYNRSLMMCQLPDRAFLGGLASMILPALSAEARRGRSPELAYLRAIEYMTALQWPALIVLCLLAHPAVWLLLGPQWLDVVPLVRIVAVASLLSFTDWLNYPLLVSLGAMRDNLLRGLIAWPISALLVAGAAFFGLTAVALSMFLTLPFQAYVSIYFIRRHVPLEWRQIGAAVRKSAVVAGFTAIGPTAAVVAAGLRFDLSVRATVVAIVASAIGWIGGLWLTRHPLLGEMGQALAAVRDNAWEGAQSTTARD